MRCWLAGLMLLVLSAVAGAESPPPAAVRPAADELARTLALFDQVDSRTLPADQRQALYLAVADALLNDGQQERALAVLAELHRFSSPAPGADLADQLRPRLERVDSPALAATLQAGTPLAALIGTELARRDAAPQTLAPAERSIGVLLPLSGRYAPYGQSVRQGMELARTVLPSSVPIRFDYRDTAGDAAAAATQLQELAIQPGVQAVLGPLTSGEAAPVAAQAEREGLPLLLLAPREGAPGGQVFRNALTAAAQVQMLADYAVKGEGLQRFAVLHPANRPGELFADLFQGAVEQHGARVIARQGYPAGAVDLRQALQVLASEARRDGKGAPDALFLPDEAWQAAQIIPQLGFARLDLLQLLGTSAWNDPELVRLAGPQCEGAVFVDGFFAASPRPEVRDFVARFQAAYGTPPGILEAQGYDAARILLTLLARPEVHDRQALRRALGALHDFPGVTGLTRFGPDGEAQKTLFLLQVQDGTVVQIN